MRVALAGIAMRAPHLLVLDEPSNHLDMVCHMLNGGTTTNPFLIKCLRVVYQWKYHHGVLYVNATSLFVFYTEVYFQNLSPIAA